MRKDKTIFWLVLISLFLLPYAFSALVDDSAAASSDVTWVEEDHSTAKEATNTANSGSTEVDQTVARSSQENLTGTFQGGHQILQASSASSSASFSRHIMCKGYEPYWNGSALLLIPIDPTTIFKPSDTKAVCLTTVSVDDSIEFRWYYRNDSSKTWVLIPAKPEWNWSWNFTKPGVYDYETHLYIAGWWPGYHYPRAYKVDVHLDDSSLPSFSEFFEVTNSGLNSPRMCGGVDLDGNPLVVKSRFTRGVDTKAYHYLRFDKIAYFNDELGYCHNFTTVWIQPDGSTYKTYSGSFPDYKDTDATWNYWQDKYVSDDYISIDLSTPVGNWKVEVYLDSYFNNTWMRYGPVATTPFIIGSEPVADWTFMVYLDADNTLENASINVFLKMAEVVDSPQVNIVAQMDRTPGYDIGYGDWTDCKRFNVTEGMIPTPGNAIMNLGEVNMGHPDTLKDFINWTINNFPANYYFLVLWDHGAGCMGLCFDINATDFLSLPELSQALRELPAIMDAVFLDACAMSMTEVAYQIKDCANVLVGPEGLGYAPAPYDDYLSSLINDPSMSPSAFASEVVNYYIDWCKPVSQIPNATMSATDLTRITSLTATIDDFALGLKEKEVFYNHLMNSSRNLTEGYPGPYAGDSGYLIDLYHFAQLTYQHVLDEELQNTASQVMTALESVIIINATKARPDSHGLSIFFPDEKGKYDYYASAYEETAFAKDTPWKEFVKYHLLHQHQCYITVNSSRGNPTTSQWVDQGDDLTVTVTSPNETIPSQTQWNCTGYRIDDGDLQGGTSYTFENVQAPHKIEFYWVQQFWLQVNTTESGSTVEGTGWYDNGTSASISTTTPHQLNSTHRFVFTHWNSTGINEAPFTDPSSSLTTVTMNNYYTVQANWQKQYHLTVNSAYGMPTGQDWYDSDTQATFSVTSPVDHDNGTRRVFIQWTGDSNANTTTATILMGSPHTVTANWKTQFMVTFAQTGLDSTATGTVLTVNGDTKTFLNLPNTTWVDDGGSISHSYSDTISSSVSGKKFSFVDVTGPVSPISITGPVTVTGNYKIQYEVTFDQSGVGTDFTGTVVTVDGTEYNDTVLPVSFWWDFNSTHTFDFHSPLIVTTNAKRYVWNSISGLSSLQSDSIKVSMSESAIGKYKTQYYLTINTNFGTVNPSSGWHDAGSTVQINASTLGVDDGERYAWLGWAGTGDGNYTGMDNSATIAMNSPITETASWRVLAWWETLLRSEMLQVILALAGTVLTVTLVGTAWVRTRRRKGIMKAPVEPVPIEVTEALPDRINTGYADLDNLLFGGIPENYAVILTSPSCDERDVLIKRFLETGAKESEVTFYITVDPAEVKNLAEEFQSNFYLFICNPQADMIIKSLPNVFKIKGVENLTDISIALTKAFRRLDKSITGPKRACIEIISAVLLQHHAVQTRRWLTDLITELKSRGFTILAVMNPKMHPSEEVHAMLDLFEGEINIYERAREEKFLKIKKMHNQRYLESELPLKKKEKSSHERSGKKHKQK